MREEAGVKREWEREGERVGERWEVEGGRKGGERSASGGIRHVEGNRGRLVAPVPPTEAQGPPPLQCAAAQRQGDSWAVLLPLLPLRLPLPPSQWLG